MNGMQKDGQNMGHSYGKTIQIDTQSICKYLQDKNGLTSLPEQCIYFEQYSGKLKCFFQVLNKDPDERLSNCQHVK
jgi:hypothetical protein